VHALGIAPQRVGEVAKLIDSSKISASNAAPLLEQLALQDQPVEALATTLGLIQSSDAGGIDAAIDAMLASNPKPLQEYRAGKQSALGALMGIVMKSGKGLNPKMVQERLKAKLG
jgi:aspartyl-tRNA(Asn)/glutamyl-tRNA(Gln) amidotransferase subunit B